MDFNKIKLIITDLDGTLTDGCYRVTDTGIVEKSFYSRDFYAIQKAQEEDIEVLIFTHAQDSVIDKKIEMLPHICKKRLSLVKVPMSDCKKHALKEWISGRTDLKGEEIAYIGDGENDLEAMSLCGWTGCPSDAAPIIKEGVNYSTDRPGGYGSVNEFIMDILERRRKK